MIYGISGGINVNHLQPTNSANNTKAQQPPIDSDGDRDGSKPGEVENKATSGTVGTIINTKA